MGTISGDIPGFPYFKRDFLLLPAVLVMGQGEKSPLKDTDGKKKTQKTN